MAIIRMPTRKKDTQPNAKKGGPGGRLRGIFSRDPDAPRKSPFVKATEMADNTVGKAHGALSRVNYMVGVGTMFGGMALGAARLLGRVPLLGNLFNPIVSAVDDPEKMNKVLEETKLRDVAGKLSPSRLLGNAAKASAEKRGADSRSARNLQVWSGKVQDAGKSVGAQFSNASASASVWLEKHGRGTLDKLAGRTGRKAGKLAEEASGIIGKAIGTAGDNEALAGVKGALQDASKALGKNGNVNISGYQEAMKAASEGLSGLSAADGVDKKTLRALKGMLPTAEKIGTVAGARDVASKRWANLPKMVRHAPETIPQTNLKDAAKGMRNVALKGAVVTGAALSVTSTTRGVNDKVFTLKNLYCDMTGEKKVSTRKVLFGRNVPDVVKEARGHIIKEYGPRVLIDAANLFASYAFWKNSGLKSGLLSAGLQSANMLHKAKVQGYGILPMYEALSQMPEIEDIHYAGFITAASKNAAKIGGIESPLVRELATDYAREGIRPADILKEMESGRFDARATAKMEEIRAASERKPGGGAASKPLASREVMGAHTQRVLSEERGNSYGVKV